jgi:hypothetical protein
VKRPGIARRPRWQEHGDIGNLRFYQRLGFRLRSIDRDAFTEATGYAAGIVIDGIERRDRVRLDRPVGA